MGLVIQHDNRLLPWFDLYALNRWKPINTSEVQKLPRRLLTMRWTVAAAVIITSSIAVPGIAQATDYRVNLTEACKSQYGGQSIKARHIDDVRTGASTPGGPGADDIQNPNRATPYGYYCVESAYTKGLGFPGTANAEVTEQEVGGLDIQAYCNRLFPGSSARGNYDTYRTWDCVGVPSF